MQEEKRLTRLLEDFSPDDRASSNRLMEVVYDDLQRMAEKRMQEMFGAKLSGVTLEPAALVNETYLRLLQQQRVQFENRQHFFAVISKIMLRVLVDYYRRRRARKRPNKHRQVGLSIAVHNLAETGSTDAIDIEEFETVLAALERAAPRKADVVKMRVIWGMTHEQVAESLGVSQATAERDWAFAKSWLLREIDRMRDGVSELDLTDTNG